MMAIVMLSLVSNPFNPFTEFDLWYQFDHKEGFDTAGFQARLVSPSPELPDEMQEKAIEDAVDGVLANPSFQGLYKKVTRADTA
jgi:hypothetical protein